MEKPLFGKRVIWSEIIEAKEFVDSKYGIKERDKEASFGEFSITWLKSKSDSAMSKETPSFDVYCIFGFCDSKSQTMLPAKGRKCWRVKESEDLRFGTIVWKKNEGSDCEFGRV